MQKVGRKGGISFLFPGPRYPRLLMGSLEKAKESEMWESMCTESSLLYMAEQGFEWRLFLFSNFTR